MASLPEPSYVLMSTVRRRPKKLNNGSFGLISAVKVPCKFLFYCISVRRATKQIRQHVSCDIGSYGPK